MNSEDEDDQCESDIDGFPVGSPHSPVLEDPDCDGCREEFGAPSNCTDCPYRNHPKAKPIPCSHPPEEQHQVQADITDDTVIPGFYCRLCGNLVSEYGPSVDDTGDIGDFDHDSPVKKLVDGKWVTIREAYPPRPYVSSDDDISTKDELPPGCDYHPTDYCMDPERGSPSTILSEEPRKCRDVRKDCKCSLGYEYPYNIDHILRKVKEMLSIEHPTILDAGVAEVYIDDALAMVGNITPNRADGPKSPCCGVATIWINARQRYICPNCGNCPSKKPAGEPKYKDEIEGLNEVYPSTAQQIAEHLVNRMEDHIEEPCQHPPEHIKRGRSIGDGHPLGYECGVCGKYLGIEHPAEEPEEVE